MVAYLSPQYMVCVFGSNLQILKQIGVKHFSQKAQEIKLHILKILTYVVHKKGFDIRKEELIVFDLPTALPFTAIHGDFCRSVVQCNAILISHNNHCWHNCYYNGDFPGFHSLIFVDRRKFALSRHL